MSAMRAWCCLLALSVLTACGAPSLGTPWLIDRPRVVAMVADPADGLSGDRVTVRAMVGGASSAARYVWTLCTRPEEASSQLPLGSFGQFEPDRGCASPSARGVQVLPSRDGGLTTFFDVDTTILNEPALWEGAYGTSLSREDLQLLVQRVGLPLVVTLEVLDGERSVRAYKRVVVKQSGERNSNPPPPRLTFGDRALVGNNGVCTPGDQRGELSVAQGERVRIAPLTGEEAWLETFTVYDNESQLVTLQESPFYNFFTTAGTLELGRTRMPDRDPTWVAPSFPGETLHWIVVRDGRGGTAACRYRVVVR